MSCVIMRKNSEFGKNSTPVFIDKTSMATKQKNKPQNISTHKNRKQGGQGVYTCFQRQGHVKLNFTQYADCLLTFSR